MKQLRGRNAIVTGASRGIGVYIARALAREGVNLVLAARSAEGVEETRRACEAIGVRAIAIPCDVSTLDGVRYLVAAAERELGEIDILVNNAGIEYTERYTSLSFDQIDELLNVNLHAPMWLSKLVLPGMMSRRRGAIVNVASLAGKSPTPFNALYSASKYGLVGFTESLHIELEGSGVNAGVVCPGFVADAGMWATHEADGSRAPRFVRPVAPERVAQGVLKAIRGTPEVIVAAGPMRPLLALGEMAPRLRSVMIKRLGVRDLFGEAADRDRVGGDRPERQGIEAGAGRR